MPGDPRECRRHALRCAELAVSAGPQQLKAALLTLRARQVLGALGVCATIAVCTLYVTKSTAQSANEGQPQAESNAAPIHGITIPAGYRNWRLISVSK